MPTDPALIAWIPPEGCDVLRPTVGRGQAPAVHEVLLSLEPVVMAWWPGHTPDGTDSVAALLLAYNGEPVPAGMDAGRRVLGLGPLGIPLRSVEGHHLGNPRDLALLLQARVGGRAVFADSDGREVEP